MDSPFSLRDKTILVTGASSGIGRACAIECSKLGAKIILTARDETRLAETYSRLSDSSRGGVVSADISDRAGLEKVVGTVSTPLDGIVHCAGASKLRPFAFATRKQFEDALQINTLAPLELTQMLLKKNILKDGSSIVFISSIAGTRIAAPIQTTYASSKAALCGAAKAMALELAPRKIRVNCICPGMVETPMHKSFGLSDEQLSADREKYPLARYGTPEEVAYAAIYLLSDASAWTTGSELVIDGGRTLA